MPGRLFESEDAMGKAGLRQLIDMRDKYSARVGEQEYCMATYAILNQGRLQYGFTPATTDGAGTSASVPVQLIPPGAAWVGTIHNHPSHALCRVKGDIPSTGDLRTLSSPGSAEPRGCGYVLNATWGSAFKFTLRPGVDPFQIRTAEPPRGSYLRVSFAWS